MAKRKKRKPIHFTRSKTDVTHNFSPEKLVRIFRNANHGNVTELYRLSQEIEEKPSPIAGLLNLRKQAIKKLPYSITAPEGDTSNFAKEVAEAVHSHVQNIIPDPSTGFVGFNDLISQMQNAINPGIAVFQQAWSLGMRDILGFEFWEPTYFTLKKSRWPRRLEMKGGTVIKSEKLEKDHWIVHTHNPRGGDIARGGLIRPLAYWYALLNPAMKQNARALEKFIEPFIALFTTEETIRDKEKREELEDLIFNFGGDGGGLFTDDTKLSFLEGGKTASELFESYRGYIRREISQLLIGTDSGTSAENSNRSTARVQNEVRLDILINDAADIALTIRSQVFKPYVIANFGANAPIPILKFKHQTNRDMKEFANGLKLMRENNYELEDDNAQQVNKETGYKFKKIEVNA